MCRTIAFLPRIFMNSPKQSETAKQPKAEPPGRSPYITGND